MTSPPGARHDQLWDLGAKAGALTAPAVARAVAVSDLPLSGADSVVGRSIVVHDPSAKDAKLA